MEGGEVFLPPDELLVLGSHGSNHVIEVHDNMHECVEQAEEGGMSAGGEANAEPYAHRHDTVVDDMQQRDMLLFLAQHEEELHTGCIQLKKQKTKKERKKGLHYHRHRSHAVHHDSVIKGKRQNK